MLSLPGATLEPGVVLAQDSHVWADTSFQLYEVRSPGSAALMTRRRLLQRVGFDFTSPALDDDDQVHLHASLRARLDHNFGETCLVDDELCYRSTDESRTGTFVPIARDTVVDVPQASVRLTGLPVASHIELGRQLVLIAGLSRLDGLRVALEPSAWVRVELAAGLLVRDATIAGTDAFVPQGVVRRELPAGYDPSRAPDVFAPSLAGVLAARLELGDDEVIRGRVGVRHIWDGDGVAFSKLVLGLVSRPIEGLRVDGGLGFDLVQSTLVDAQVGARLVLQPLSLDVRLERHVPLFDAGSIWAYFDLAPVDEASISASLAFSKKTQATLGLRGRRAELSEALTDLDGGVYGSLQTRLAGTDVSLDASLWGGSLAPLASVALKVERAFGPVRLGLRASVWHFDAVNRQGVDGTSLAEALYLVWQLTARSRLMGEVQHAVSKVVGHRFRLLGVFSFEVWR